MNLFEQMIKPKREEIGWEDVEKSALSCQEKGCYEVVSTGKYSPVIKVLTWKCSEGHISKIEDFHFD